MRLYRRRVEMGSYHHEFYFLNLLCRSWGLAAHRGPTRPLLDLRCVVGTSHTPRGCSSRNNFRSEYGKANTHGSYKNPEPGFRAPEPGHGTMPPKWLLSLYRYKYSTVPLLLSEEGAKKIKNTITSTDKGRPSFLNFGVKVEAKLEPAS